MGLSVSAKGMTDTFDNGYLTFYRFRTDLANKYNEKIGNFYEKLLNNNLEDEEYEEFEKLCPKGLFLFLMHSDCDGKFTPQECRLIYNDIKDLSLDMQNHNYGDISNPYNTLERWKSMFLYCYKRRVNMYFY